MKYYVLVSLFCTILNIVFADLGNNLATCLHTWTNILSGVKQSLFQNWSERLACAVMELGVQYLSNNRLKWGEN